MAITKPAVTKLSWTQVGDQFKLIADPNATVAHFWRMDDGDWLIRCLGNEVRLNGRFSANHAKLQTEKLFTNTMKKLCSLKIEESPIFKEEPRRGATFVPKFFKEETQPTPKKKVYGC